MKQKTVLKALWVTLLLVVIALSAVELSHRWDEYQSSTRQLANMARAREHLPLIRKLVEPDKRFEAVNILEYSGGGGSIMVSGTVKSEQDLRDLTQIVQSPLPPVAVVNSIWVDPPGLHGTGK